MSLQKLRDLDTADSVAVVLMTPDDVGGLVGEPQVPRARENVVLELGYFLALLSLAGVTLRVGVVHMPKDLDGLGYIDVADSGWKRKLASNWTRQGATSTSRARRSRASTESSGAERRIEPPTRRGPVARRPQDGRGRDGPLVVLPTGTHARRHAHARIVVAIVPGEQSVDIRVADDGTGVAPEAVDTIFGRFVSLDGLGGCGLGLPIARELARAYADNLVYRDGGFVLRLPLTAKNI